MTYADPFVQDRFVAMLVRHSELFGEKHLLANQYLINDKTKQLGVRLGAGRREGLKINKDEYVIECAPGSIFTGPVVITGSAIISGAMFTGTTSDPLIDISGSGQLILHNCLLTKEGAPGAGSYVSVSAAGKLLVSACLFTGAPGGGNAVVTAGGNAAAVGNINTTGVANGAGVVTLGEVV